MRNGGLSARKGPGLLMPGHHVGSKRKALYIEYRGEGKKRGK